MLVDFAFQLFDLDGGGTLSADEIGILVAEVYGVRSASALDKWWPRCSPSSMRM